MKKITLILMIITLLSQASGFARELVLSYYFGASKVSDAYLVSLTVPMVIYAFVGKALSTTFTLSYSKIHGKQGEESAFNFSRGILKIFFSISLLIAILCVLKSDVVIKVFASGFDNETIILASNFLKVSIFGIFSMITVNIYSSILRYHNKHISPSLTGLVMNVIVIIAVIISVKVNNLLILSIGTLVSIFAQSFVMIPDLKNINYELLGKANLSQYWDEIKQIIILSAPVILGVGVNEINVLVDKNLASNLIVGGISSMNYANKLIGFVYGVCVFSVNTVFYPRIVKFVQRDLVEDLKTEVLDSLLFVSFLVVPASLGLMCFSTEIIEFVFYRGSFTKNDVLLTSGILFYYSLGIIGTSYKLILSNIYYAHGNTTSPMLNASIGVVLNIILNFALSGIMGINGLALATSVSALITSILMFINLKIIKFDINYSNLLRKLLSITISGLIMAFASKQIYYQILMCFSKSESLFISIFCAIAIYILMTGILNVYDLRRVILRFKEQIIKK